MTRFTEISAYWDHSPLAPPKLLSKISSTLAREIALRFDEPLKITSCMESPRISFALDSPSTQRMDSMTLDLPQPLGPTTPTRWPCKCKVVVSTKDLNPASFRWVRRNCQSCFLGVKVVVSGCIMTFLNIIRFIR